jgi:tRNA dimethylallyltransferase
MWFKAIEFVDSEIQPSKKNIFSIVGLTATGKTNLAFSLAKHILDMYPNFSRVDIISADSRQIYQDIPVVSGADVPSNFTEIGSVNLEDGLEYPYFQNGKTYFHGVSILPATEEWSVAHFQHFAQTILRHSWNQNGCLIVVGGTGLYHAHLFNEELLEQPGPSESVRAQIANEDFESLQRLVQQQAPEKWGEMNQSDRNNSRRLVRVLEQTSVTHEENQNIQTTLIYPDVHKTLYLGGDLDSIVEKISLRVDSRIQSGALSEIEAVVSKYEDKKIPQMMTATGVRELLAVVNESLSLDQAKGKWIQRERKYAKQQKTWWKSHEVDFELEV